MVSQHLTHVLKYILKLHKQRVVVAETLENPGKGCQLKMTGWKRTLFPETPLLQQGDLINIFKATRTERTGEGMPAAAFCKLGAESTFEPQDFRKLHLTPQWVYTSNWIYTGNPPKAQALLEVGGLKQRAVRPPDSFLRGQMTPPPQVGRKLEVYSLEKVKQRVSDLGCGGEGRLEGGNTGD